MLRRTLLASAGLMAVAGSLLPAQAPAAEASADSTAGLFWNIWNNVDTDRSRWVFNPGGSTYRMQAHTAPGPLPAGEPPAAPAPALGGINVLFPAGGPATKFVEAPAGIAVNGKDGLAGRPVWGPGAAGGPLVAGALPNLGQIAGRSDKGLLTWTSRTDALANAAGGAPGNHAFGKAFDPWSFHDFAPFDPDGPNANPFLTVTQALTYSVDLDVTATEPGGFGLAGSAVSTALSGLPSASDLFSFDLRLSESGGVASFTKSVSLGTGVRLFGFSISDGGTPGDTSDDEVILGGAIADPLDYLNSVLDSFFDPLAGTVSGSLQVAMAMDLPFSISQMASPGFFFGAVHDHAAFTEARAPDLPEPSTTALIALGLAFLLAGGRRRGARQA